MKRLNKKVLSVAIVGLSLFVGSQAEATSVQQYKEMHRLYNPNSGEHFYTANTSEKDNLVRVGWQYENIGWYAPMSGDDVYRMYNPNAGDHHYTTSIGEKDMLISKGWDYEGVGWYSDTDQTVPLYRAYNPNAQAGSHNYTANDTEQTHLIGNGWVHEGIAWYGMNVNDNPTPTPTPDPEDNQPIKDGEVRQAVEGTLAAINDYRASKGLVPLKLDNELVDMAMLRSTERSSGNLPAHTRPDGSKYDTAYTGSKLTLISEVSTMVLMSQKPSGQDSYSYIISDGLSSFQNSSAHNNIILNDKQTHVGFGYYAKNGVVYVNYNLGREKSWLK